MDGVYVTGLRSHSRDFANLTLCWGHFPLQTPNSPSSVLVLWSLLEFIKGIAEEEHESETWQERHGLSWTSGSVVLLREVSLLCVVVNEKLYQPKEADKRNHFQPGNKKEMIIGCWTFFPLENVQQGLTEPVTETLWWRLLCPVWSGVGMSSEPTLWLIPVEGGLCHHVAWWSVRYPDEGRTYK